MKKTCTLFFSLLFISLGYAQSPIKNKVLKYSLKDGLSFDIVNSITQDNKGFMWFATNDGLNRFDGTTFKTFKSKQDNSSSLASNYVQKIFAGADGSIWVSSRNGLSRLNTRTEKFTHYKFGTDKTIKNDVSNIVQSGDGNLWISSYGLGFSYFNTQTTKYISYNRKVLPQLSNDRVIAIYQDSNSLLWLGMQDGSINVFRVKNGVVTGKIDFSPQLKGLPAARINNIYEDHFHNIWIATGNGLIYYNRHNNRFSLLQSTQAAVKNKRYISLIEDSNQQLLVGLQDGGLYKVDLGATTDYDTRNFMLEPVTGDDGYDVTQRSVQTLYLDKDKNIWVGTYGDGIYMISSIKEKFAKIIKKTFTPGGESLVRFYGMCQDNEGYLWIGTDGDGIFKTKPDGSLVKQYKADGRPGSLTDNAILCAYTDSYNNTWLGTYAKGLFLYNKTSESFTNFSHNPANGKSLGANDVRVIYQDSRKDLWIGTNGGGLSRLNSDHQTFSNYTPANSGISSYDVRALAEDKKGNLWIGTYGGGIVYYNLNQKKFSRLFNTADEKLHMPSQVVFSIYPDQQNQLWIGTEGDGLIIYNLKTRTFKKLNEKNGLANNTVYAIKEANNGIIWLSTNKGLSSIDTHTGKILNFDQSDGLQAGQFNVGSVVFDTRNKLMYFGGTKGLNIFDPQKVSQSNYKPKVMITGLQIFGKQIEVGAQDKNGTILPQAINETSQLVLQPDQSVFSIQYVSLNYAYPQKGDFAYKLEGLDKSWNYVGNQRSATYRYLEPGDYVFKVKASNQDNIWFDDYVTLKIKIMPPWYKTWWAYLCYMALIIMIAYYYMQYRANQSRLKYDIRIAQLSAEKDKELNERKLSFFTNISHEFRTPLTLIINPVKDMLFGPAEKTTDAGNLNIVYRNARRLLSLVDQLLLFRKAENDTDKLKIVKLNIVSLYREVFLCFNHQARSKNIQFDFFSEAEVIEILADREKIEIALFNLISNALKFTPEHGTVTCTIINETENVNIEIKDTGCGITEGTGDQLFNKFYQIQNTAPMAGGFGIGLYLVKVFIENHKGRITYTSKPHHGTTFKVTLLKGKEHFGQQFVFEDIAETSVFLDELIDHGDELVLQPEIINQEIAKNTELLSSDTKTMLLIEDNQQIREYLKQIFINDFEVFEADNGTDGLDLVYHLVPDIVISDVMMQGLSGIELCSRVKEDPVLNHIPVILLTASSSPEIKLKGIEGGADDYISKPFEKEILIARVNGILKSRNNLQKYFYNEITLKSNDLKISQEYKDFLEKCLKIIEQHLADPDFNIKTLAAEIGMSHSNLYKKIRSISGQSANSFIRFIRLRKAAEIFLTTDSTVYETAYKVGLNDLKYFREQFNKLFGLNPSDYIKKYRRPFHNNYNVNRDVIKEN
ncbi:hybrid sensor histidine kinase/response regulator transcription factor [Mucilaginibacter sp. SP1R1]|uniref:hybrid sensor histidine kinase/response regulator transcription factor n=1 Tax=Mucilaginibacter sp. SP1R1 TaxID=2723091 RepID=UPI001619FE13|nr:two-component regulator propeller domain-containing protein [Mucilaginibacter sp. SP1R1]MBB6149104.1 signal transduction histidine kinase/ligand-binding sensor domain-containing protein/CheY-like chemotaxis protein [Mucilaginibacter sp. SP1R1]